MTNPRDTLRIVGKCCDGRLLWTLQRPMADLWPAGDPVPSDRETLSTIINWQPSIGWTSEGE